VWGRFLGKGEHNRISFLSRNDAFRLIEDPLRDIIRYEEGVAEQIWHLTSGQPFYTQVFCQALVDHLNEVRENQVTKENLKDVVEQVIENPLPQMIFAWNSLTNLEKIATSIIGEIYAATGEPVTADEILTFAKSESIGFNIDSNVLRESLEKSFTHDVLTKDDNDGYAFKMGLWQRWVSRMHSIWQVIDEVKSSDELGPGLTVPKSKRVRIFIAAAAVLVGAYIIFWAITPPPNPNPVFVPPDSTHMSIITTPPGAEVFLGTQRIGEKTPVDNEKVEAGTWLLSVEMDGYRTKTDSVTLDKDVLFSASYDLVEETGALRVTSSPEGADVYLDGQRTGLRTPTTLSDLSVNKVYEVQLRLSNFVAKTYPAETVYADSTRELRRHNFATAYATVTINSEPAAATVLIDGNAQAKPTPDVYSMAHGSRVVVIRKYGYHDSSHSITVTSNTNPINATLTKLPMGKLILVVQPYGAIEIDGNEIAKNATHHKQDLDVGTYKITFIHPTLGTQERTVTVESGQEQKVEVNFNNPEG
jgi:hypothetical protein